MLRTLLLIFLLGCSGLTKALSYTLEVSEQQLQDKLSAMMPIEKSHFILSIILSEPQLNLVKQTNEISIFVNIKALIAGKVQGTGRGRVTGSLSYEPTQGAFYFKQPKISELEIDNLQQQFAPKVKELTQQVISKTMENYPIYTLDDNDTQQKLAKSMLQSLQVKNQTLFITLNAF